MSIPIPNEFGIPDWQWEAMTDADKLQIAADFREIQVDRFKSAKFLYCRFMSAKKIADAEALRVATLEFELYEAQRMSKEAAAKLRIAVTEYAAECGIGDFMHPEFRTEN